MRAGRSKSYKWSELFVCFETPDWEAFRAATDSLDEYIDIVTSYISFNEECIIPMRTRVSYSLGSVRSSAGLAGRMKQHARVVMGTATGRSNTGLAGR